MAAVVTEKAFTETALLMTGGTATAWQSIAVGTGSQTESVDNTALATEITANGLARASCATASVTDSAYTGDTCLFVHTFTAESTYAVKECGIFNSSANGDMLCYGTFATAVPMSSDDTLKITWSVKRKACAAFKSNLDRIMSQIRGKLNSIIEHANPELNLIAIAINKCVENRGFTPDWVMG